MIKLLDRLVYRALKKKEIVKAKRRATPIWFPVNLEGDMIKKFKGVNVGYYIGFGQKGFFVYSSSARSKKFDSIEEIPDSIIKRIKKTT